MRLARPCSSVYPSRRNPLLAAAALAAALAVTLAAGHADAATNGTRVTLHTTPLGRILANAQGRTLYMFAIDKHGKSACYGKCAAFWPPLLTSGKPVAGPGVNASLLGTTMRTGGKLQVTYAGRPLYRFVTDTKPGQTAGQGLNVSGGLWWVMSEAGTIIKKTTAAAPTSTTTAPPTTTSGGYGGYGR